MTHSASAPTASQTLEDAASADSRALVRRLIREQIRPQSGRIAAAFACMIVVAAAAAGMVLLIGPVIDDVLIDRDREMLYLIPGAIIVLALVTGAAGYAESVLMDVIGHRMVANLQRSMYERIICADLRFFHDNAVGQLISRFVNDAALLRSSIARALTGLVKDSLTVVFLAAVMFYDSWQLALVTVVTFPLALYPIRAIGRRMRKFSRRTQVETGDLTTMLDETFRGIRHVKAYTMEARETDRAGMILEKIFQLWRRSARVNALSRPLMEMLGGVALALAAFFGGILVIEETLTAGALASFMAAVLAAYKPMKSIATLHASLQQGLAAAQRIFQLQDLRPSIADRPGARSAPRLAGNIRFDGVRFGYGDGTTALDGVDLEIPAGKTVALVGSSGAGKTTMLNLIPRFFDVEDGAVRIDGHDVRDLTLESLRGGIALVSQEISLFDDTIRANIAYGKPGVDEDAVAAAARDAGASEFVEALPEGYETRVGGDGVKLSGGQRQRIAIARAIIKDAPILLLDEATSALDTQTERLVQTAIARLKAGRTTVVVAHRLSTVIDADVIVVMAGGRIVETGGYRELLARGGAFARLHALQFSTEEEPDMPVGMLA